MISRWVYFTALYLFQKLKCIKMGIIHEYDKFLVFKGRNHPLKEVIKLKRENSSLNGRNQALKWDIKLERGKLSLKGITQAWKREIKPDNSKFHVYRIQNFLKVQNHIESLKWLIFSLLLVSWISGMNIELCLSVYRINLWNCWPAEF